MSDMVLKANRPLCFSKQIHDEKTDAIQDINEPAIELYVRQQGSFAFKFSVINKKLIVEATRDGKIEQLPIDGIPSEFQTNLNAEKITKIQTMLEQCYFGVQGGKVLVNVRGLGGWGTDIHKGYTFIPNDRVEFNDYGTYKIAIDLGYDPANARAIADANNEVDVRDWRWNRALRTFLFDEGRHFGGNSWDMWMTNADLRYRYALQRRNLAVQNFRNGNNNAGLVALGEGLHALQDSFAHNPSSAVGVLANGNLHWHGNAADDINNIPMRIEFTRQATRIYLSQDDNFENTLNLFLARARIALQNAYRAEAIRAEAARAEAARAEAARAEAARAEAARAEAAAVNRNSWCRIL